MITRNDARPFCLIVDSYSYSAGSYNYLLPFPLFLDLKAEVPGIFDVSALVRAYRSVPPGGGFSSKLVTKPITSTHEVSNGRECEENEEKKRAGPKRKKAEVRSTGCRPVTDRGFPHGNRKVSSASISKPKSKVKTQKVDNQGVRSDAVADLERQLDGWYNAIASGLRMAQVVWKFGALLCVKVVQFFRDESTPPF